MGCGSSLAQKNKVGPREHPPWSGVPLKKSHHADNDNNDVIKGGPTWRERLEEATNAELWDGQLRTERYQWKGYLQRAEKLANTQRKSVARAVVTRILEGDLHDLDDIRPHSSKVTIFLSSTFTDTKAERNQLMKDVFPFLRRLCNILGMDFGSVDMRWGVREETTREHGTADICLQQIARCRKESCGPAFLTLLGNKYGYRPLPTRIEKLEFEYLLQKTKEHSQPVNDLTENYLLDENNVPPLYILKPRDDSVSDQDWWDISQEMQRKLKLAARSLPLVEQRDKYYISVTEQEIREGCSNNDMRNSQVVYVSRNLIGIRDKYNHHRHFIDLADGEIDEEAQDSMDYLKFSKLPGELSECPSSMMHFDYKFKKTTNCLKQVKETCDEICRMLCEKIFEGYTKQLELVDDPLYSEILKHSQFLDQRTEVFKGREKLVTRITEAIVRERGVEKTVTGLYGTPGSGKTAAIAHLAKSLKTTVMPEACLVLRFIGTTSDSGSVFDLLLSICQQITRVYGKNVSKVPDLLEPLQEYLKLALTFSTEEKPLLIVLDSVDQLFNETLATNLKWLSLDTPLPPHTHVLVSVNSGEYVDILKAHTPKESIFELPHMQPESALEALAAMIEAKNRTTTDQQLETLKHAFEWNPFPLYLKMLVDVAVTWRSYDVIPSDRVASGVSGLTSLLFGRLEGKYGKVLVHHALAYISASKNGLSQNELEDVLSCDDDALDELFEFWLPPVRRIPPLLWIRIRNDLSDFLMEKGSDGTVLYSWYYRQVRQTAAERYLDRCFPTFRQTAHRTLADYFEGKWISGKVWTPKAKSRTVQDLSPRMENRMVTGQPLMFSGKRGESQRRLNKRKLRELPYHLLKCGDLYELEKLVSDLEFLEAKFEAGQGYDCMAVLKMAAMGDCPPLLQAISKVVSSHLQFLLHEPSAIYQMIRQQSDMNPTRALLAGVDRSFYPLQCVMEPENINEDPCDLTLRGHTSGVRCCQYSPDGAYIASTGQDGTLRIWDAQTGSEHVTCTGLAGPTYARLADTSRVGGRPCVWDQTSSTLITGSEDGFLQAWTRAGGKVKVNFRTDEAAHSKPITGLSVSSDNLLLASCSKDGTVKLWCMKTCREQRTIALGTAEIKDCKFSDDGTRLGLVLVDPAWKAADLPSSSAINVYSQSDWKLKSVRYTSENRKLGCLSISPGSEMIATGSDWNTVELWADGESEPEVLPKQHHGHVTCVQFTHGGKYVISCSADFMVIVWHVKQRRHLAMVAGHLSWAFSVSVNPNGEGQIVSASQDTTLNIWNYTAMLSGRVPEVDGLPFNVLLASHNRKYIMAGQGMNSFVRIYEKSRLGKGGFVGRTPKKKYIIRAALWTVDDSRIVILNDGHAGNYTEDAYNYAGVQVFPFKLTDSSETDDCVELDVKWPVSIGLNKKYIAVGTKKRHIHLFDQKTLSPGPVIDWERPEDLGSDLGAARGSDLGGGEGAPPSEDRWIWSVCLHPSKDDVAALSGSTLRVWGLGLFGGAQQKISIDSDNGENGFTCLYSPNGRYLIYNFLGTITLLSTKLVYNRAHVITAHLDLTHAIAVCPKSRHLASCSLDGTLRVWRLKRRLVEPVAVYYNCTARTVTFLTSDTLLLGGATGPPMKLIIEQ